MRTPARRRGAVRIALAAGAALIALALAGCGGDDDAGEDSAAEDAAPASESYRVEAASCPPGFLEVADATSTGPIEFAVAAGEEGSSLSGEDAIDVGCASESDGDEFPFEASAIELTVAPAGSVSGSATWSDSVGLTMNATISGSAADSLAELDLELTAPNGDTLSELALRSGS